MLSSIRTKLVTDEVAAADQVHTVPNIHFDQINPTLGDYMIFLGVGEEQVVTEGMEGSAWFDFRCIRTLNVLLFVRMNLDEVNDYESWLEDSSAGILEIEDDIVDSLYDYFPVDSKGNELVYEGMGYLGTQAPQTLDKLSPGWGGSMLSFSISYQRDLTNASKTYGR